ncbi:transposable element Tc1 transposase [Trichonephila clavipes]|nr:transposable element Tc1 transposase [Trichonephila clavipes]
MIMFGLEVACPFRKPKVPVSTPAGVDRFSGYESHRHALRDIDESRFQLCPDDHRRRVWRPPGKRTNPVFTIALHTGRQPGVMVWGPISFDSRTPLAIIRGTLNSATVHR